MRRGRPKNSAVTVTAHNNRFTKTDVPARITPGYITVFYGFSVSNVLRAPSCVEVAGEIWRYGYTHHIEKALCCTVCFQYGGLTIQTHGHAQTATPAGQKLYTYINKSIYLRKQKTHEIFSENDEYTSCTAVVW